MVEENPNRSKTVEKVESKVKVADIIANFTAKHKEHKAKEEERGRTGPNTEECKNLRRSPDGVIKFCISRRMYLATGRDTCAFAWTKDRPDCKFYEKVSK